jgi:DNA-directed RNA polymerase specialized sigma24 family protein
MNGHLNQCTASDDPTRCFCDTYPRTLRAARVRAGRAVRSTAVPPHEYEDVVQEAITSCWIALPQFNPDRASLPTYFEHVIANRVSSVKRASHAGKRSAQVYPLDVAGECTAPGDWVAGLHLRLDVHRVLRCLAPGDRAIALLLMKYSPTEATRVAQVSRSKIYRTIGRLRAVFTSAGFGPGGAR